MDCKINGEYIILYNENIIVNICDNEIHRIQSNTHKYHTYNINQVKELLDELKNSKIQNKELYYNIIKKHINIVKLRTIVKNNNNLSVFKKNINKKFT